MATKNRRPTRDTATKELVDTLTAGITADVGDDLTETPNLQSKIENQKSLTGPPCRGCSGRHYHPTEQPREPVPGITWTNARCTKCGTMTCLRRSAPVAANES